jgi:hypothetical protein
MGSEPEALPATCPGCWAGEHGGDPNHGAEGANALSGRRARLVARKDGRGVPPLERDPYQDEDGEG